VCFFGFGVLNFADLRDLEGVFEAVAAEGFARFFDG